MSVDIEELIQNDLEGRTNKILRERALREYYNNPNRCKYCNEIIVVNKSEKPSVVRDKQFCNSSCAASYNNKGKRKNYKDGVNYDTPNKCLNCGLDILRERKYCSNKCQQEYEQNEWEKKWFAGEVSGNNNSVWADISGHVRTYLFNKYDRKCAKCGWGETNPYTGTIPLEVEHIDGNANNTTPDNVTLLCPNCHSLTATYKGANKGNGRSRTWIPKPIDIEI